MAAFQWTCPHCSHVQTVVDAKQTMIYEHIGISALADGMVGLVCSAIGCSNPDCGKLSATAWLQADDWTSAGYRLKPNGAIPGTRHSLTGRSGAKAQPEYIPQPLRDDYFEACAIRETSPKASATLIRRCLQGMIRDFAGIAKGTLDQEIKALSAALDEGKAPAGVTHESVEAIDHVRGIGNIGAHMEKDINVIVEVEPDEAQLLIELAELLFEEWYVARHKRQERLARLGKLAAEKKAERLGGAATGENETGSAASSDMSARAASSHAVEPE